MTIDKFLLFWSLHNTAIIEGLVAFIIVLALYIAYRGFFGKSEEASHESGGRLDAVQLEKTLQKILENQGPGRLKAQFDSESALEGVEGAAFEAGASPEMAAEVVQLKQALAESRKNAETLAAKAKEAEEKAAAAAAAGGGAGPIADEGMSAKEKEDFAAKIRDLEARLAEYEIISEDIADLSRYREENDELRKEVETMKAGGAVAPPAAAAPAAPPPPAAPAAPPAAAAAAAPVEAAAAAATPAPAAEPIPEPEPEPAVTATPEPTAAPAATADAPAEVAPNDDLIDDDLMKEFAAAVESQQAKTLEKVAEKAGQGKEEAKSGGEETKQLMGEFEDFVAKKS